MTADTGRAREALAAVTRTHIQATRRPTRLNPAESFCVCGGWASTGADPFSYHCADALLAGVLSDPAVVAALPGAKGLLWEEGARLSVEEASKGGILTLRAGYKQLVRERDEARERLGKYQDQLVRAGNELGEAQATLARVEQVATTLPHGQTRQILIDVIAGGTP